jgi:hypothetical protein
MPGPGTWQPGDILTADDLNDIGAWQTYTPTLFQNGSRTATVNYAKYAVINKMCIVNVDLTCTTTGSASNAVSVSLPIEGFGSVGLSVSGSGAATFFDSSANDVFLLSALVGTTQGFFVAETSTTSGFFGAVPDVTLGNNDVLSMSIVYQTV